MINYQVSFEHLLECGMSYKLMSEKVIVTSPLKRLFMRKWIN